MKKLKEYLDPGYTKICIYAGMTFILTGVAIYLLYLTGGFWSRVWSLFTSVLRPVLIGGIFCYLFTPLVNRIERRINKKGSRPCARSLAVILCYLFVALIIAALVMLLLFTMYRSISAVSLEGLGSMLSALKEDLSGYQELIEGKLGSSGAIVKEAGGMLGLMITGIKNTGTGIAFGIVISVYLLLDGKRILPYWKRAFHLMSGGRYDDRLGTFLADADRVFSGYIRGQFVDAVIVGALSSIAMLIAGVPSALVVGILTGIGNLIPYIGPVIGYVTLAFVCLLAMDWGHLAVGALILAGVMAVDSNLINPRLLSNNVMVHPLLVVVALIGGGAAGGFIGMIIAVPAAALIKIQFDKYLGRKEKENGSVFDKECI